MPGLQEYPKVGNFLLFFTRFCKSNALCCKFLKESCKNLERNAFRLN